MEVLLGTRCITRGLTYFRNFIHGNKIEIYNLLLNRLDKHLGTSKLILTAAHI